MDYISILLLFIGLAIGFIVSFWLIKSKQSATTDSEELKNISTENTRLLTRLENAEQVFKQQKEKEEKLTQVNIELIASNSKLEAQNKYLEEKLAEQKQEIEKLQERFTLEFQNIANKLLKENSKDFAEANQKKLDEILVPLKENIKMFEKKVDEKYETELKERTSLVEQIKSLTELNQQMRSDAQNLTKALKGDSKTQGDWGEFILEKILDNSGLKKGEQYETQENFKNEEGNNLRPDAVIKLPENKHIIIDSKVSIVAYTNFLEAKTDEERTTCINAHKTSIKNHINGLSQKNYPNAKGANSPDFVLMFLPSESSFSFTLQADSDIYSYAWDKKIVLVSPTTLLATLRTIASVWKQELQTRNALEIAKESGNLYDKFVGFIEDMQKIGKKLGESQSAYDDAFKKLQFGNGNLITRAEKLRALGAKNNKNLPKSLVDDEDQKLEIE
ncbi:MAG: DNA recombination protein RmuC [Flavobacteriales bacterium]|nr:DNA recombination protein RmuC [Flavobacteriales bacterium]